MIWLGLLPGTSPLDPSGGWSIASQLVLPVAVLVLYDLGYVVRMVRASMVDVMTKPYIRTAILKGLRACRTVVIRHALRNAMIAPFTVILLQINFLITGVVVIETVFAYPGFGRLILEASLAKDISMIEAATLIAADDRHRHAADSATSATRSSIPRFGCHERRDRERRFPSRRRGGGDRAPRPRG